MALQYKTSVAFNETPNGILKVFTTTESFYYLDSTHGSLSIVQGAIVKTDFTYTADKTVTFDDAPDAPATAGTLMIATGLFGESGGLIGLWSPPLFQLTYNVEDVNISVLIATLYRADIRVQGYITSAAYADAILSTPVDPVAAELIKTAIGDLALYYLRQTEFIELPSETYSESYSGVVSFSQSSGTSGKTISQSMTEGAILGRLAEYADSTNYAAAMTVEWGTGRYASVSLVDAIVED